MSVVICTVIHLPIPQFLLACLRSKYYLTQNEENSNMSDNAKQDLTKPQKVLLAQVDPVLPLKLLFLVNSSSHEKL